MHRMHDADGYIVEGMFTYSSASASGFGYGLHIKASVHFLANGQNKTGSYQRTRLHAFSPSRSQGQHTPRGNKTCLFEQKMQLNSHDLFMVKVVLVNV